jgi:Flp pilus assembly protein TadG
VIGRHRLRRDERGISVLIVALTLVTLVVMAALAIDLGDVRQVRSQEQNAADAGALAGAQDLPAAPEAVAKAAGYAAATMSSTRASSAPCGSGTTATACFRADEAVIRVTTPFAGDARRIEVVVCQPVELTFARMIDITTLKPCRRAVAAVAVNTTAFGGASILVLKPEGTKTLICSGSCDIAVGDGSVVANSITPGAIDLSGSARIAAGQIHGHIQRSGASAYSCSSPPSPCPTDQRRTPDPLAGLPTPAPPSTTYPGGKQAVFDPGRYTGSLKVNAATACFNPGTYYLEQGMDISGQSQVTLCPGTTGGVFLYIAGGTVTISGGSSVRLTPLTTGPYAGVLIFQARGGTQRLTLSGGSGIQLPGALYVPDGETNLTGGSTASDALGVGQIITHTLTASGNSTIGPGFVGGTNFATETTISLVE